MENFFQGLKKAMSDVAEKIEENLAVNKTGGGDAKEAEEQKRAVVQRPPSPELGEDKDDEKTQKGEAKGKTGEEECSFLGGIENTKINIDNFY